MNNQYQSTSIMRVQRVGNVRHQTLSRAASGSGRNPASPGMIGSKVRFQLPSWWPYWLAQPPTPHEDFWQCSRHLAKSPYTAGLYVRRSRKKPLVHFPSHLRSAASHKTLLGVELLVLQRFFVCCSEAWRDRNWSFCRPPPPPHTPEIESEIMSAPRRCTDAFSCALTVKPGAWNGHLYADCVRPSSTVSVRAEVRVA